MPSRFPESRHPILRVSDDPWPTARPGDALPPLLSYNRVAAAVSNATVLAHHPTERADGNPMPMLALRRVEAGKAALVAYQTFWRHGLMMWGDGKTDIAARAFWKNMTRWLVTRDDVSRLKLMTEKTAYRSGEGGRLYTRKFLTPVATAFRRAGSSVACPTVLGVREVALRDLGGGRYAGNLGRFPQGDYEYQVNDGDLGTGTGHFTVGRYSLEYETVRIARRIARGYRHAQRRAIREAERPEGCPRLAHFDTRARCDATTASRCGGNSGRWLYWWVCWCLNGPLDEDWEWYEHKI